MSKRRILMSVFFNSQFNYCPLVWMCHNFATNRKLNKPHQKCLRIICNYVSLKERLKKNGSVSTLFTIKIFNVLLLRCLKLAVGYLHLLSLIYLSTKAVVQRCYVIKPFLKISQNSQENSCTRVTFLVKL